jgi:hypothetical protein
MSNNKCERNSYYANLVYSTVKGSKLFLVISIDAALEIIKIKRLKSENS